MFIYTEEIPLLSPWLRKKAKILNLRLFSSFPFQEFKNPGHPSSICSFTSPPTCHLLLLNIGIAPLVLENSRLPSMRSQITAAKIILGMTGGMTTLLIMKTLTTILSLAALSISFTTSNLQADTLADVMKTEGIDNMLGTWVDADTNGEMLRITYKWKIKGHSIEVNLKTEDSTSSALIVFDQASEEVLHMGVNSKGELGRGTWSAQNGVAILDLTQTDADGQEVEMKISHKVVDKNSMTLGFEMKATGEGGELALVRPAKKAKKKTQGK